MKPFANSDTASPSPQPSPQGRGSSDRLFGKIPIRADSPTHWRKLSLSLMGRAGVRAGVRGNQPFLPPPVIDSQTDWGKKSLRLYQKLFTRAAAVLMAATGPAFGQDRLQTEQATWSGVAYTNIRVAAIPWSIHLVRVQRTNSLYQIQSAHAGGNAIGLETLSEQIGRIASSFGKPIAGINGDFYQREKAYAGAPRGLQVVNGELISGPSGGVSFWIDALAEPHTTNVAASFRIIWPNGKVTPFSLNGERRAEGIELYSPAIGTSTHTVGGRELVLSRVEGSRWLPLRLGQTYTARVTDIRDSGNTSLAPDMLVLSLGPSALPQLPTVQKGAILRISTESIPALRGVKTAISGGPVLVRDGKRQKVRPSTVESYEFSSMLERHPRTAIGWNEREFLMIEVDGRQKGLSVGMSLDELSAYLLKLGCSEAMNLDGGGSATLWFDGQVKNSPCDRQEREIANCLVILKRTGNHGTLDAPAGNL